MNEAAKKLADFTCAPLLISQIVHVTVGSKPWVISEIKAHVVGIVVDHDIVGVPPPVVAIVIVVGRYAKEKSAKPKAFPIPSSQVKYMTGAEATREVTMLPGMFDMEVRVSTARIMSHPGIVRVNVGGFRMPGLVPESTMFRGAGLHMGSMRLLVWRWRRAVRRNMPVTPGMFLLATVLLTLSKCAKGDCGKPY
jgi:hypothetical protein